MSGKRHRTEMDRIAEARPAALEEEANDLEVIATGHYLRLLSRGTWEYVERIAARGAVVIVAVTSEGRLVLVEQPRPALGRSVIELPAGLVGDLADDPDEALETAAHRELIEETGYRADTMVWLAGGPTSPGLSGEMISFFRAGALERVGPGGGDDSEDITVHEVALPELRAWLHEKERDGCALDPKLYAGLFLAGLEC
jgi:ADP-ribose pyrophosphatase